MELDNHKFIGLSRDKHPINLDPNLLWDAKNIRITNRDDNTLLSITNEKGTLNTGMMFIGDYVGHCSLGEYIILFIHDLESSTSRIYRIEYRENLLCKIILYAGKGLLDPNSPIECLGCYETELIQKVYWVDKEHLPRMINIKELELKGLTYSKDHDYTTLLKYNNNSFDFCPTLQLKELIKVEKLFGQGEFLPGTIQYAFSYYKKYGQESKIFYTTPIYYISHSERGGAPDHAIPNTFNIKITNLDDFDYLRVYSIHRTSIDATPTIKVVSDVKVRGDDGSTLSKVELVDTGTIGYTISDTLFLYVGGTLIKAKTIALKDGTMFLGHVNISSNKYKEVEKLLTLDNAQYTNVSIDQHYQNLEDDKFYTHISSLNEKYSAGFKAFETYRCGIQVQFDNGEWSLPIHIGDKIINDQYPWDSYPYRRLGLFKIPTSNDLIDKLSLIGAVKIRSCVVFPNSYERDIVCQGILAPTVFNVGDRASNAPYAQSSWFFRSAFKDNDNDENILNGASIQFQHNKSLFTGSNRGAEVQNSANGIEHLDLILGEDSLKSSRASFFVDENIVTMHSPEVEFDSTLMDLSYSDTKLRIVGIANLSAIAGDIDIYASASAGDSGGPIKKYIGYTIGSENKVTGGLVSGLFYEDAIIKSDYSIYGTTNYLVYPWHRSGSLNNDKNRPSDKGSRTAVLNTKTISNLKFFGHNSKINSILYNITLPLLFNSDNISVINIDYFGNNINYYGNVDTVVLSNDDNSNGYNIYNGPSFLGVISTVGDGTKDYVSSSRETVRMKYKSSPHLVFSLKGSLNNLPILPRHAELENSNDTEYIVPAWDPFSKEESNFQDLGTLFIYSKGFLDNYSYSNRVGFYGIGNYNPADNTGYLARVINTPSGVQFAAVTGRDLEEDYIILQYSSAGLIGMRAESDCVILNTKDSDYIRVGEGDGHRYFYNGPTIYYKCTFLQKGVTSDIKLDIYTPDPDSDSSSNIYIKLNTFSTEEDLQFPYVLIGELYRDNVLNKFGGNSAEAKENNIWIPSGEAIDIRDCTDCDYIDIPFEYGDTWYQRYDCLKTYPYTKEDPNLIVEIGSFMCETRVNIDGRYDKNRGLLSNLNISKDNFNLISPVYSLKNNIFTYRILDDDFYKLSVYGNLVLWTLKKLMGGEVDLWTNISLLSYLDTDGKYGEITKLQTYNNTLLTFLNKCLSIINFNEKTLIPVSEGLPIEISNNYKVTGYQVVQEGVGCSDSHSIVETPLGIYFIDSATSTLWKFDGKLSNISDTLLLKLGFKELPLCLPWSPLESLTNGIKLLYDHYYDDVYIVPGPTTEELDALCYSNRMQSFTSYLSYGGISTMFNIGPKTFSLKKDGNALKLWLNFVGDYNYFFGKYKPFSISFISNNNSLISKIFDIIEYRADMYNKDELLHKETFNYILVDNDYQDTTIRRDTDFLNKWNPVKKFRIWRGQIPRDLKDLLEGGRAKTRICNPWTRITLGYDKENYNKMILHDIIVKYTV